MMEVRSITTDLGGHWAPEKKTEKNPRFGRMEGRQRISGNRG